MRAKTKSENYYLIGVGTSAGGLDAIRQLIAQIPKDFRHSLVIIQHLSPDHKSLMSEILSRDTALPVCEVANEMEVAPGMIYVIPPRSNIVVNEVHPKNGNSKLAQGNDAPKLKFSFVEQKPRPQLNLPIDMFFSSLAETMSDRSIAVVLSGTGSDGSRGAQHVKDRDGFVVCQTPETALFDGMPRATLGSVHVDLIASPDAMVREVLRYIELRDKGIISVDRLFGEESNTFSQIIDVVGKYAVVDLTLYKEPTLKRRIARRIALSGADTASEYLQILREDDQEKSVLYREFLVGVTNFFRDRNHWEEIEKSVLPDLFSSGNTNEPLKIWSVGCSTGEEAYSIAIMLEHWRRTHSIERDFRVFATDINENSLKAAKEGVYPASALDEIPECYKNDNYVLCMGSTISISSHIRKKILFICHNIVEDAPYVNTDMITCRNLLIYLDPSIQKKLFALFSFSLLANGVLFLGASESVAQSSDSFSALTSRSKIFRNVNSNRARNALILSTSFPEIVRSKARLPRLTSRRSSIESISSSLLQEAVSCFNACIVLVDDHATIQQTFGDCNRFFELPKLGYSTNLMDLLPSKVRSIVALVIRQAMKGERSQRNRVKFPNGGKGRFVSVDCWKLQWDPQAVSYAVLLSDRSDILVKEPVGSGQSVASEADQAYIEQLEIELESAQDLLRMSMEDLGVSNEELQASNEELTSANEELQANNEEIQSVNEELQTLNLENIEKIEMLEEANSDIENLLDDTLIGKLLLNSDLTIRRFTTGFIRYVNLNRSDVGRHIGNFSTKFDDGSFEKLILDAELSCSDGEVISREIMAFDGCRVIATTRPLKSNGGDNEGSILSLVNMDQIIDLLDSSAVLGLNEKGICIDEDGDGGESVKITIREDGDVIPVSRQFGCVATYVGLPIQTVIFSIDGSSCASYSVCRRGAVWRLSAFRQSTQFQIGRQGSRRATQTE